MYHEKEERGNGATSHPILTLTMSTFPLRLEISLIFDTRDLAERALAYLPELYNRFEDASIEEVSYGCNLHYYASSFMGSDLISLRIKLGIDKIPFTVFQAPIF